jgi:hypothetical protein
MSSSTSKYAIVACSLALGAFVGFTSGCGQADKAADGHGDGNVEHGKAGDGKHGDDAHHDADAHASAEKKTHSDSDDGWWCDEHGVPEGECGQCDSKLAADFQKKKDWCAKHDRPDSQCFVCHPEREAKFAARYVAKYGKKPPKPTM